MLTFLNFHFCSNSNGLEATGRNSRRAGVARPKFAKIDPASGQNIDF